MSEGSWIFRGLRRQWWIVVLLAAVAIVAAAFFTSRQRPIYRATTSLIVVPNTEVRGTGDVLRSLETLERRTIVATFAKLPASPRVRDRVMARFRQQEPQVPGGAQPLRFEPSPEVTALLQRDPQALRGYRIQGSVLPYTNIIKIEVEGPNREVATEVANAAAYFTTREARRLYRIYTMRTLEEAYASRTPIHPDPKRNYLVAGVLGLFLGVAGALAVEGARGRGRVG